MLLTYRAQDVESTGQASAKDQKALDDAAERLARRLYRALKRDDPTAFVGRFQPGIGGVSTEHLDDEDIVLL